MLMLFKLINGTEIIGNVVDERNAFIHLEYPIQVNVKYIGTQQPSTTFSKYVLFAASDVVVFNKAHIMHVMEPRDTFKKFYDIAVRRYYHDFDDAVDEELSQIVADAIMGEASQEEVYTHMLEALPVDKMSKN
jgi:hypothetical protein